MDYLRLSWLVWKDKLTKFGQIFQSTRRKPVLNTKNLLRDLPLYHTHPRKSKCKRSLAQQRAFKEFWLNILGARREPSPRSSIIVNRTAEMSAFEHVRRCCGGAMKASLNSQLSNARFFCVMEGIFSVTRSCLSGLSERVTNRSASFEVV